jgi:hypothetical protein
MINRVGAATRASALPARSGLPPREMTSRTRPGRSAAVVRAVGAPVLAPKIASDSGPVSLRLASQSAAPVSRSANVQMSKRSSRVRWSISSPSV